MLARVAGNWKQGFFSPSSSDSRRKKYKELPGTREGFFCFRSFNKDLNFESEIAMGFGMENIKACSRGRRECWGMTDVVSALCLASEHCGPVRREGNSRRQ